jgi:LmbE family N-acetylglucosaminyl deacetylase
MASPLRFMAVLAHPDDESLGTGAVLAQCAAEGVDTYLVCATRGERGWSGEPARNPGLAELGRIREAELRAAAQILGIREVSFLDYMDGELDQANPLEATAKIVAHLRRVRPQVILSFGPDGAYGHPDHIAISQLTTAAAMCAADPTYNPGAAVHRASKLYYFVDSRSRVEEIPALFGSIRYTVDGVERQPVGWEEWSITTRIDASAHLDTIVRAIKCHESQRATFHLLDGLPADTVCRLLCEQTLYRAFSTVNGGRAVETDVFEGLR